MTALALQAVGLGFILALIPSILVWVWLFCRDGAFSSPQYPSEILIEDRLAYDLRDCASRVNDPVASPEAVAARVRLIMACRILLQATGFQVDMVRKPLFLDDEDGGEKGPTSKASLFPRVPDVSNGSFRMITLTRLLSRSIWRLTNF